MSKNLCIEGFSIFTPLQGAKTLVTLVALFFSFAHGEFAYPNSQCYEVVKKPAGYTTRPNVLIFIPDVMNPSRSYSNLASETLKRLPENTYGIILRNENGRPTFAKALRCINSIYRNEHSTQAEPKLTILGHSYGGLVAQALTDHFRSANLVLLGSYLAKPGGVFSKRRTLESQTNPTLILGGTADGYTRAPWVLREFNDLERLINDSRYGPEQRYKTPVVMLHEIKNSHFSDGRTTGHDLPSSINLRDAQQKIAKVIANFIVANDNLGQPSRDFSAIRAQEELEYIHENTRMIFRPFTQATKPYRAICETGQRQLLNRPDLGIKYISAQTFDVFSNFRPEVITRRNNNATLTQAMYIEPDSNWADISYGSFYGQKIVCKFVIVPEEETSEMLEARVRNTCQKLNDLAFSTSKNIAMSQHIWPLSSSSWPELSSPEKVSKLQSYRQRKLIDRSFKLISPAYSLEKETKELQGVQVREGSCSILSIASILEWTTIGAHLGKKGQSQAY